MTVTDVIGGLIDRLLARRHKPRYSVPDDVIRRTGIRFTPAELAAMADDFDRGAEPPPLSYNEAFVLGRLIGHRTHQAIEAASERIARELTESLALPEVYEIVPADRPRS